MMGTPFFTCPSGEIYCGDAREVLRSLPDSSVQCCITSPPYWGLRDYGVEGQLGLEPTPSAFVAALAEVFDEVRRVLSADGTLWLNISDTYIGYHGNRNAVGGVSSSDRRGYRENMRRTSVSADNLKNKDMAGIPWRLAFALQSAGWYLRADIIWHKPNPMPESVQDRPTRAHEYLFLFSKASRYHYDATAIAEPLADSSRARLAQDIFSQEDTSRAHGGRKLNGNLKACGNLHTGRRNKRTVWTISPSKTSGLHFATFPDALVEPCLLAGCPVGGTVLDPFCGSGTVCRVAVRHNRRFFGIELNPDYTRERDGGRALVVCLAPKGQSRGDSSMPNISEFPNAAAVCSLSRVLETGPIPSRFFLSSTACAGILRRSEKRKKTLPGPLRDALIAVAQENGLKP